LGTVFTVNLLFFLDLILLLSMASLASFEGDRGRGRGRLGLGLSGLEEEEASPSKPITLGKDAAPINN
jgi:hypothetical protein